jgi:undecaprenyl-diphosphatase
VVVVISAIGFTILATVYRSQEHAGRIDTILATTLRGETASGWAQSHVSTLGTPEAVVGMSVLLAVVAAASDRGWRAVVLGGAGPTAAALLTEFALKPFVERRLRGDLAFPSGHATGVAAVATAAVVIVVAGRVGRRTARVATSLAAVVAVLAVGTSLVALDQHYATDVVGGVLVAIAVVSAIALVLDLGTGPARGRSESRRSAGGRPRRLTVKEE